MKFYLRSACISMEKILKCEYIFIDFHYGTFEHSLKVVRCKV